MDRRCPEAGQALIRKYEGLSLRSYLCPAGVCTIGYGHTGPEVKMGMTITRENAEALLRQDLGSVESSVDSLVRVPLNDHQFAALCSLVFNIGIAAFAGSTLLRLLNTGDYGGAASQFPRWKHCRGRVSPGLVTRRSEEQTVFCRRPDHNAGETHHGPA